MIKLLICSVFIFSIIFMGFKFFNNEETMVPKEEQIVNSLISRAAKKLEQKYKIRPVGTSVSMPRCIVKNLGIHFQIRGPMDRNEIRITLVSLVKDFLLMVNEDLELKPLLESYPFTAKNVDIDLFIVDDAGRGIRDPHISMAGVTKGKVDYTILVQIDGIPSIKDEFIESYDEALKAL